MKIAVNYRVDPTTNEKSLVRYQPMLQGEFSGWEVLDVPDLPEEAGAIWEYAYSQDGTIVSVRKDAPKNELQLVKEELEKTNKALEDVMLLMAGGGGA